MARLIGKLAFVPQDPDKPEEERQLAQDFGFVRDDGLMVIAQRGGRVDGASVPRFMWRVVGHPFFKANRFWSVPHDALYRSFAVIINLNSAQVTPETALDVWRDMDSASFIHSKDLSRKWCDDTLRQAMGAMDERAWKRRSVYCAVRMFGGGAYRK